MLNKETKNTIAGSATVAGAAGGVLPALFRAFGWVDWGASLSLALKMYDDPRLNWEGIWLLSFIFGSVWMLVINSGWISELIKKHRESRNYRWNEGLASSASYIEKHSAYGLGLELLPESKRFLMCCDAVLEAAKAKKLPLAGAKKISDPLQQISLCDLKGAKIAIGETVELISQNGEIRYSILTTDKDLVRKLWPYA